MGTTQISALSTRRFMSGLVAYCESRSLALRIGGMMDIHSQAW